VLEKTTKVDYPWCKNIKYWKENSIVHSFANSQFCSLLFNCEIDECILGFNSCILDLDLGMATWAFRHYKLHEKGFFSTPFDFLILD
jgi:hypothetical protein